MRPLVDPPPGVRADVPLAPLTTLGVGGNARWFVRATAVDDVVAAYAWSRQQGIPVTVIGGGSNLVVADSGVDGLVVQIAIGGIHFRAQGGKTVVRAGAGETWDAVVAAAVARGCQGVECLSGIPGTVGGTPVQNVGAYGQEVADTIAEITAFEHASGEVRSIQGKDCGFGYRMSRFKSTDTGRFVVCDVTYELTDRQPTVTYPDLINLLACQGVHSPSVADVRAVVLSIRRSKGMVLDASDPDTRSVGSFFMNPIIDRRHHESISISLQAGTYYWRPPLGVATVPGAPGFPMPDGRVKVPAAFLIERTGFAKGYEAGPVGLSSKHPLAIVNKGGATARDIVVLARRIQQTVADHFDVWLQSEPKFIGFGHDDDVQSLVGNTLAGPSGPSDHL